MAYTPAIKRTYEFWALVAFNTAIAFYITEIVVFLFKKGLNLLIDPPRTLLWAVWANVIITVICGFLLGFCAWLILRMEASKWVWVLSSVWLAYGMIRFAAGPSESVLVSGTVWHQFFGLGSGLSAFQWLKAFSEFTLPFVSGVTYSLGAHVSSLWVSRAVDIAKPDAAGATSE